MRGISETLMGPIDERRPLIGKLEEDSPDISST